MRRFNGQFHRGVLCGGAFLLVASSSTGLAEPVADGPRCAVFGADLTPRCLSFPNWKPGTWTPPPGAAVLHVLLIGGGGGGAATIQNGIGGTGGGSGQVREKTIHSEGSPIFIRVGRGGRGGRGYCQPGRAGGVSLFGDVDSSGGEGGSQISGGGALPDGNGSGGGGAGGGFYHDGHGGAGGAGGKAGGSGYAGLKGTDSKSPISPTAEGLGSSFPPMTFSQITISPGEGGGGGTYGIDEPGYGGGGGGGGGGVLLQHAGGPAASGASGKAGTQARGGAGGQGYGSGGGGGGNYIIGAWGGSGADGIVYVEWPPALIAQCEHAFCSEQAATACCQPPRTRSPSPSPKRCTTMAVGSSDTLARSWPNPPRHT